MSYRIGDVITHPVEPPLGTTVESRDRTGPFQLTRHGDGWHLHGRAGSWTWRLVVDLWLPITVVGLPGVIGRCSGCGRWIARGVVMCDACIDSGR